MTLDDAFCGDKFQGCDKKKKKKEGVFMFGWTKLWQVYGSLEWRQWR
jgi:hypothetical protein